MAPDMKKIFVHKKINFFFLATVFFFREKKNDCAICQETLGGRACASWPGCGHQFHVKCMIGASQYDVRCAVCRVTATGVVARSRAPEPPPSPGVGEGQLVLLRDAETGRHVVFLDADWRRHLARRRRLINRAPRARDADKKLKVIRKERTALQALTHRAYQQKCRELWKHDEELGDLRNQLLRLRRRERRLERVVDEVVEEEEVRLEIPYWAAQHPGRAFALKVCSCSTVARSLYASCQSKAHAFGHAVLQQQLVHRHRPGDDEVVSAQNLQFAPFLSDTLSTTTGS